MGDIADLYDYNIDEEDNQKYYNTTMKRKAPELEDFADFRKEFEDGDELALIAGTLTTLYDPQGGKFPRQNGYIEDENGNKLFITFAVPDMFLPKDFEGKFVTIESKEGTGRNSGKWTGVKVKDPNGKGNQIWVTGTASVYDEDGDQVETGGVDIPEKGDGAPSRGRKRGGNPRSPSDSRSKNQSSGSARSAVDVFQLTEEICNVNMLAFDLYRKHGIPDNLAAVLAANAATSVSQWWFGEKAPMGIDEVAEELVARTKPKGESKTRTRKRRKQPEPEEEEYEEEYEEEFEGE